MPDSGINTSGELASQPPMPVRRLQNYLYCPRQFYLQWVENIFEVNADTAMGTALHRQANEPSRLEEQKATALREGLPEGAKLRSLRLESEALGLVGVMDIVEGGPDGTSVVDYKKGSAKRGEDGERHASLADSAQVAAYALILREHGTAVESAAINNTMLVQIAVLAWIFLGEPRGPLGWLGIAVVSIGALLAQSRRSLVAWRR